MTDSRIIDANKLRKTLNYQRELAKETMYTYPAQENYYRGRVDSLTTALLIVKDMQEGYAVHGMA